MSAPTRTDLEELFRESSGPLISAYLPTHRAGPEIRKDPIRLKNLLRDARARLIDAGRSPEAADALLEPATKLVGDRDLWRHQDEGLALFLGPGGARSFNLPSRPPELVVVGERFHLTPLLPFVRGSERFHVLALSQKRVRLFAGDAEQLTELRPAEIPEDLRDVVGHDYEQRTLQFRTPTAAGAGGGDRAAMFHGHGEGVDDRHGELLRFLHGVDKAVVGLVQQPRPPLVLAAVQNVAAEYRKLSRHEHIVDGLVEGNPDDLSAAALHERAWPLVEAELAAPRREAVEAFESLRHTDRTATGLERVVSDCEAGRVDSLLVARGESRWGRFDVESREVELDGSALEGSEDLVGRAAMECLLHGGKVFVLPPEQLPADAPMAAVRRY